MIWRGILVVNIFSTQAGNHLHYA